MTKKILEQLKEKLLVLDGGMGTELQKKGFTKGCPDELNIKDPALVKSVHKSYADAGANIIITNTFGANRIKLKEYKLQGKVKEINEAAVKNVRDSCPGCLVAGDIGPLGAYIEPLGALTFDKAYEAYAEQAKALAGADLLIIETVADIKILKAALIAAKQNSKLPVIVSMTFDKDRTVTGTDIETFVEIADSLGADVIGTNCTAGPKEHLEIVKEIAKHTNKPIITQPNAGLPKLVGNKTVFPVGASEFASFVPKFISAGANLMGGCCGTTPEHIAKLSEAVKDKKPKTRNIEPKTKLCSRLKSVVVGEEILIVGERINPTNKADFSAELKAGKTNYIRKQALTQVSEGASFLDINVGLPGTDEVANLKKAVDAVQNIVDIPLVLDTSNPEALEAALKQCAGKPLINSVYGSEKSLNSVLPLAKKYGACILVLTLEKALPKSVEERISVAKKIIKKAEEIGIRKQDIIVDCVVTTIATHPENEQIILDSVKEIKKLGYKTLLGISNISYGLPNRSEINSKFFTKAAKAGLDLAILNPLDKVFQENTEIKIKKIEVKVDYDNLSIEQQLHQAILYGDKDNIAPIVSKALEKLETFKVNDILIDALTEVGEKFDKKEYFLPQVLLSADAMKNAFEVLKKKIEKQAGHEKGVVILATVENDIHDIGKNIVKAVFESHNLKVIDLGKDVSASKIVEAAKKHNAKLIGLSALMTTTAPEMEKVIKALKDAHIHIPVLAGGAVITLDYAHKIKAHYAEDAIKAAKRALELIEK
ncbi:homocysteine S-methyltransferase family protein [Candidatus Woesearchaeota archaeon]|nr:homocysteine S-methyltransferase family protein [Candidatus Woesearchaeota archaeon]